MSTASPLSVSPSDLKKGDTLAPWHGGDTYWVAQEDARVVDNEVRCDVQFFPDGGHGTRRWSLDKTIKVRVWRTT